MNKLAIIPLLLGLGWPVLADEQHHAEHHSSTQISQSIEFRHAWVRAAGEQQITAAFVQLRSAEDKQLVAVHSDLAEFNEVHTHSMVDGMMQMREISHIDLPANQWVNLQPGGLHLMLINLQRELTPGEEIPLQLLFADGEQLSLPFQVMERTYLPEAEHHSDHDTEMHHGHHGH